MLQVFREADIYWPRPNFLYDPTVLYDVPLQGKNADVHGGLEITSLAVPS